MRRGRRKLQSLGFELHCRTGLRSDRSARGCVHEWRHDLRRPRPNLLWRLPGRISLRVRRALRIPRRPVALQALRRQGPAVLHRRYLHAGRLHLALPLQLRFIHDGLHLHRCSRRRRALASSSRLRRRWQVGRVVARRPLGVTGRCRRLCLLRSRRTRRCHRGRRPSTGGSCFGSGSCIR